jgi:hypothetical protein
MEGKGVTTEEGAHRNIGNKNGPALHLGFIWGNGDTECMAAGLRSVERLLILRLNSVENPTSGNPGQKWGTQS